jgi:hypothetical protein
VASFALGIDVVITNQDHQQWRKDIMQVCRGKVGELMVTSKMKSLNGGLEAW